jgi:hypothetical protein
MKAVRDALLVSTLMATLVLRGPLQAQDDQRVPVPEPAALKDSQKLVREVYREDFAKKSPSDRVTLARKLLEEAGKSKNDPVAVYVLLSEGRDAASEGGNIGLAFQAIEDLASRYQVQGTELKGAALLAVAKTARGPEDMRGLAEAYLSLVEEAQSRDSYEAAEKAAGAAVSWAKKAKDPPLSARAEAREKESTELKRTYEQVKKSVAELSSNPEDPAANLIVGRFRCLIRGDWEAGLPALAKSIGSPLQPVAQKDLGRPMETADQVALGDAWWDLGEKESGASRSNVRQRAVHWYLQAVPKLAGLSKAKIEKRLVEVNTERLGRGSWVDITQGDLFGLTGRKGEPLEIVNEGVVSYKPCPLKQFPPGVFDGFSLQIDLNPQRNGKTMVQFDEHHTVLWISNERIEVWCHKDDKSPNEVTKIPPSGKQSYGLAAVLSGTQYILTLDSLEVARVPAYSGLRLSNLVLGGNGRVKFDQIRLRRKG